MCRPEILQYLAICPLVSLCDKNSSCMVGSSGRNFVWSLRTTQGEGVSNFVWSLTTQGEGVSNFEWSLTTQGEGVSNFEWSLTTQGEGVSNFEWSLTTQGEGVSNFEWSLTTQGEGVSNFVWSLRGGDTRKKKIKNLNTICSSHNFFPLSSVQIIIIPACCLRWYKKVSIGIFS